MIRKALIILSGAFICMTGCSNITMLRTQELREVQAHVDSLKAELQALQKDMRDEQKKQSELLRLIRADQQVSFNELIREVSTVSGSIHDSHDKLARISEDTEKLKARWDEKAVADSMQVSVRNSELDNLFEIAHGDFMAGRYDVARSGFQDMIDRFPGHPMAEAAFYWKSECYYAQRKYPDAEQAFMAYIKSYPEGKKMCVAMFKLGLVYENMKKDKHRIMVWQKLLEQCPDSEEAAAVKSRM